MNMERDAARYRYLRGIAEGRIGERHIKGVVINDWAKSFDPEASINIWSQEILLGDELDREIDKAMVRSTLIAVEGAPE